MNGIEHVPEGGCALAENRTLPFVLLSGETCDPDSDDENEQGQHAKLAKLVATDKADNWNPIEIHITCRQIARGWLSHP